MGLCIVSSSRFAAAQKRDAATTDTDKAMSSSMNAVVNSIYQQRPSISALDYGLYPAPVSRPLAPTLRPPQETLRVGFAAFDATGEGLVAASSLASILQYTGIPVDPSEVSCASVNYFAAHRRRAGVVFHSFFITPAEHGI